MKPISFAAHQQLVAILQTRSIDTDEYSIGTIEISQNPTIGTLMMLSHDFGVTGGDQRVVVDDHITHLSTDDGPIRRHTDAVKVLLVVIENEQLGDRRPRCGRNGLVASIGWRTCSALASSCGIVAGGAPAFASASSSSISSGRIWVVNLKSFVITYPRHVIGLAVACPIDRINFLSRRSPGDWNATRGRLFYQPGQKVCDSILSFSSNAVRNTKADNADKIAHDTLSVMSRPGTQVVIVLASGSNAGRSYGIDSSDFLIGTRPECDVRLDGDEMVGERRLRCHRGSDGWQLEAIDGGTFYVGHHRASKSTELRSGDVIRVSHDGPDMQFYLQVAGSPLQPIVSTYLPSANIAELVDQSVATPSESDELRLHQPTAATGARQTQIVDRAESVGPARATQLISVDGKGHGGAGARESVAARDVWGADKHSSDTWRGNQSNNRILLIAISIMVGAVLGLGLVAVLVNIAMRLF